MATLGGNICNSSPAGDSLPLLYALDAELLIASGCRRIELPIEAFINGPGKNCLKPGELLAAVRIPSKSFHRILYKKVATRNATALSKLSFIGLAEVDEGELRDLRMAFGAVGPTVIRSRDLEQDVLQGIQEGRLLLGEVLQEYSRLIRPIDDQRSTAVYRKTTALRLAQNFLGTLPWGEKEKTS